VSALRRTLASLAAWTLGAGVAIVVGILALSLIDDGLAAGQPVPGLAAPPRAADDTPASAAAEPSASGPGASTSPAAGTTRQLTTPGGTAIVRCTSNAAYLVSWSPAQGYQVDKVHRGPTTQTAYVAFRDGAKRIVLAARCVGGAPEQLLGWHDDDGPGDA
jgi:hypothetical protein